MSFRGKKSVAVYFVMNSLSLHLSAIIGAGMLLASVVVAQEVQPASPPSPTVSVGQTLADSRKLFEKGDSDRAELKLQDLINSSKPETAEWHIDYGLNLMQVAILCQQAGEGKLSREIAQRALGHLDQARQKIPPPATLARLCEIRGAIYQRLLGSMNDAQASYEEAVRILPNDAYVRAKLKWFIALEKQEAKSKP